MKKIIILISLLFLAINLPAQKIYYRTITEEGLRMRTDFRSLQSKGQKQLDLALQYEDYSNEDNDHRSGYYLIIRFLDTDESLNVPQGGKVLIKTTTGTVIESEQLIDLRGSLKEIDPRNGLRETCLHHCYSHHNEYVGQVYQTTSKYYLTEEQIKALVDEGIVKIRIQTTGESLECVYPTSEFIKVGRERSEVNKAANLLQSLYTVLLNNIDPYTTF